MSQDQIVSQDLLLEFLDVAFNQILYYRKLYPKEIFDRKKIYGTSIHVSKHPELNEYLRNILSSIRELINLDSKSVRVIEFIFYNEEKKPMEKFVFDLLKLTSNISEKDPYFLKTEEALRTICLKIATIENYLKPLPENSSFSIEILTYEAAHIALSENPKCEAFPWIMREEVSEEKNINNLLPLKSIDTDCLSLQMYVLENSEIKNAV